MRQRFQMSISIVSSTEADWSFEVTEGDKSYFIRDKDLDNFGRPLGRDEARKRATEQSALIRQSGGESLRLLNILYLKFICRLFQIVVTSSYSMLKPVKSIGRFWLETPNIQPRASVRMMTHTVVISGITLFVLRNADGAIIDSRQLQALPGRADSLG